jgi:hypothetical protein
LICLVTFSSSIQQIKLQGNLGTCSKRLVNVKGLQSCSFYICISKKAMLRVCMIAEAEEENSVSTKNSRF